MEKVRSAGVLLHLTSLPGPYGIGVMGEEARQFVLQLQRMSFHYWQVLPLCPVDDTGSPYCACSANAGYPARDGTRHARGSGRRAADRTGSGKHPLQRQHLYYRSPLCAGKAAADAAAGVFAAERRTPRTAPAVCGAKRMGQRLRALSGAQGKTRRSAVVGMARQRKAL